MRGERENVKKEGKDCGRQRERLRCRGREKKTARERGENGYGRERSGEQRMRERKERDERSSPCGSLATEVISVARRREEREREREKKREGKSVEREGRNFLLSPLLATENFPSRERREEMERGRLSSSRLLSRWKQFPWRGDTRREEREERGRDGGGIFLLRAHARMQERRKEDGEERGVAREGEEREGREEDFSPPASSRDGRNFCHEEKRGERRGKSVGEEEGKEREEKSPPPLVRTPACGTATGRGDVTREIVERGG